MVKRIKKNSKNKAMEINPELFLNRDFACYMAETFRMMFDKAIHAWEQETGEELGGEDAVISARAGLHAYDMFLQQGEDEIPLGVKCSSKDARKLGEAVLAHLMRDPDEDDIEDQNLFGGSHDDNDPDMLQVSADEAIAVLGHEAVIRPCSECGTKRERMPSDDPRLVEMLTKEGTSVSALSGETGADVIGVWCSVCEHPSVLIMGGVFGDFVQKFTNRN